MGKLIGGLLGFGKTPKIDTPAPVKEEINTKLDPNRSDAIADARRKREALQGRSGRSALRVDLTDSKSSTRSGISIV